MRRHPLFLLRRLSLDAGRWLGSWRLSIVLMVLAALYHLFLVAWSISSPPAVVRNIASLLPFWLVYGLLLANTATCLLGARLGRLRRQLSPTPVRLAEPPDWEEATAPELSADEIRRRLKSEGFRLSAGSEGREGGLLGVARRWAPLGTYLFHASFFLLALGFLLTLGARQEARLWVAVGETYQAQADQILSRTPPRMLASGVPAVSFRLDRLEPELWRDQLLFTRLEADLTFPDGGAATTRINRPLWLGWGTFLRLSGFGYAPRYELRDKEARIKDSAFVKLNVFPPGQRDFFQIPELPHRFYLEVLPDFAVEDGEARTRSLNLVHPAVWVHVYRGHLDLAEAVLEPRESVGFEGLSLAFPEIRTWGELTLVFDPGAPLIFAAYLLGLTGLALKLRSRREVEWVPQPGAPGRLRGWGGRG